ncbi:MAG: hypothetical protein AVDCRST_MAG93-1686, partial [uncultured Chloroflexia bacterium]
VDQSHDWTTEEAIEHHQHMVPPDVAICYVRDTGRGLSASRNAALERAHHRIVALTDDDCVPAPGWVAVLSDAFASSPRPDAVSGPVLPLGPERPGWYAVSSRTQMQRTIYTGRALPWEVGTGGNFALDTTWIKRVGPYDERLGAGTLGGAGEDIDLLRRLLRAGARIQYEPAALVYHERQPKERRMATRVSYGRGIGASCGLWLRQGDREALPILLWWFGRRGRKLLGASVHHRWISVAEELQVFRGTFEGLWYAARVGHKERKTHADVT